MSEKLERNLLILCVHLLIIYVFFSPAPGKIFSLPRPGSGPRQNRNPRRGPRSITSLEDNSTVRFLAHTIVAGHRPFAHISCILQLKMTQDLKKGSSFFLFPF